MTTPIAIPVPVVIAKLRCYSAQGQQVRFTGVYSHDKAEREDSLFGDTTPSADLTMAITNPAAREVFAEDKAYYTLLVPAEGVDYRKLVEAVRVHLAEEAQKAADAAQGEG